VAAFVAETQTALDNLAYDFVKDLREAFAARGEIKPDIFPQHRWRDYPLAYDQGQAYGYEPGERQIQVRRGKTPGRCFLPDPTEAPADVEGLIPADVGVDGDFARQIISELTLHGYPRPGRLGEWRPDATLQLLIDQHDIYTNVGVTPLAARPLVPTPVWKRGHYHVISRNS